MKVTICAALVLLAAAGVAAQSITDADILNFALNLEYLEAEYYSWAAFGYGLPKATRGGGPAAVGGAKAALSAGIQEYATEIANDEIAHVDFLRGALGKYAVAQPEINIGTAFEVAASAAAGVATLTPAFSPYAGDIPFLLGAFIFEDVGVTAYKGAAPLLTSKAILTAAAGLATVEAYHAGAVRTLLAANKFTVLPAYNLTVADLTTIISNLRDALDGKSDDDQGITRYDGMTNIVPTNSQSLTYSRTPQQVLNIVYGSPTGKPGLFFPKGVNGVIQSSGGKGK